VEKTSEQAGAANAKLKKMKQKLEETK